MYDKLLDKISSETELLAPNSSGKDGPTLVPIPHTSISPIQNNPPTCSSLSSLSYKSISFLPTPRYKKLIVENNENNENNNVNSDVKIQSLSF